MTNIFTAPVSTAQQMADCLPQGRAWSAKNLETSNMRKLINCLAVSHNRVQQQVELLQSEYNINTTTELISEWEISVGLPDDCIEITPTLEARRQAVIERLRKQPIVKLQDIQDFINDAITYVSIKLYAGEDYDALFPGVLPAVNKKFLIVADILLSEYFEYEFEYPFLSGVDKTELECRMNKIIPANVLFLSYLK